MYQASFYDLHGITYVSPNPGRHVLAIIILISQGGKLRQSREGTCHAQEHMVRGRAEIQAQTI